MKARRCECAIPDCLGEFPTIVTGRAHLREFHGIRVTERRYEDALMILDPPRIHEGRKRGYSRDYVPSREEYLRILGEAQDGVDRVIFNTLGEGGLRERELVHLRRYWLEDGKVVIPAADSDSGFRAKTRRAARTIPLREMNPEAWRILLEWFERHEELGVCATTVWRRVHLAGRRAKLRNRIFPHALRARCATVWAYRLNNVRVLLDIFGWEDAQTAERYIQRSGVRAVRAFQEWRARDDRKFSTLNSISPPEYLNQKPWFTILNNVKSQFTILNS